MLQLHVLMICISSECGIQIFWRAFHYYSKTIELTLYVKANNLPVHLMTVRKQSLN